MPRVAREALQAGHQLHREVHVRVRSESASSAEAPQAPSQVAATSLDQRTLNCRCGQVCADDVYAGPHGALEESKQTVDLHRWLSQSVDSTRRCHAAQVAALGP